MTSDGEASSQDDLKSHLEKLYRNAKAHRDKNACTFKRPASSSAVLPIDAPTPAAEESELQWLSLWDQEALGQLGPGVLLYFELHLLLGICFLVMFLISTPTLYWCLQGTQAEDLDPSGTQSSFFKAVAKASIGNLGTCPQCTAAELRERALSPTRSTRVKEVTVTIAWLDFAGMMVYLLFVAWFQLWWLPRSRSKVDKDHDTASDFAIQIQRLPRVLGEGNAGYKRALEKHFEKVARPSTSHRDGADADVVREVALVREYDGDLRHFMEMASLEKQKESARIGSEWASKAKNVNLAQSLEKQKEKLQEQIEAMKDRLGKPVEEVNREVCMAFVMFKTEALKAQVVHRYKNSGNFLARALQPEDLRFRGRRLHVKEAQEPSDLIWENLDYPRPRHLCRVSAGVILVLVIVVLICVLIAWLRSFQPPLDTSVSSANLWIISAAASGARGANCTQACAWQTAADSIGQVPTGSVYSILSGGLGEIWRNTSQLPMPLSNSSCSSIVSSGCGIAKQDWIGIQFVNLERVRSMRIVSPEGFVASKIIPMGCRAESIATVNRSGVFTADGRIWDPSENCGLYTGVDPGRSYQGWNGIMKDARCDVVSPLPAVQAILAAGADPVADAMVSCFCAAQARKGSSFKSDPLVTDAQKACEPWILNSRKMNGISVAATLSTLILNNFPYVILGVMDAWAKYPTRTASAMSQFINLFIAQFVNAAIITLVTSSNTYWISLFHGAYDDVSHLWWMNVGASMLFTFLMIVISVGLLAPFLLNKVLAPLGTWFASRGIFDEKALNEAFMLPEFALSMRLGESVVVVWCVLMYSGGMPFLYVIAAFYCFLAYLMDKWVLLRLSRRPPQYMAGALDNALQMLPVAVFPHALMTMSFFGQQEVFPSDWVPATLSSVLSWSQIGDIDTYNRVSYIFSYQGSDVKGPNYALFMKARMLDVARQAAWPMLFLFFLAVCWCLGAFAVQYLLGPLMPHTFECLEDAWQKLVRYADTDTDNNYDQVKESIDKGEKNIVFSYEMQENPVYEAAHKSLNSTPVKQNAWLDGGRKSILGAAAERMTSVFKDDKGLKDCEEKLLDCLEAVMNPTCCRRAASASEEEARPA